MKYTANIKNVGIAKYVETLNGDVVKDVIQNIDKYINII